MSLIGRKAAKFLGGAHFGKLAISTEDGSPHVTPIWYMYEDGKVIVNTTTDRFKFRNMVRDPRVALLVDNGYSYILIRGKARLAKERDAKKDIETLAIRYLGVREGRKLTRLRYWKFTRVSFEIVPEKVIFDL